MPERTTIAALVLEAAHRELEEVIGVLCDNTKAARLRWYEPPENRFTAAELFLRLETSANRDLNERGWKEFNSGCCHDLDGKPVTVVSVTPAYGRVTEMTTHA